MKDLELVKQISTRRNYPGCKEFMKAKLNLGQLFTMFALVICGKNIPVEKNRDAAKRRLIWLSCAHFCLGPEQEAIFDGSNHHMQDAFILSLAKSTQQKIR